MSVVTHVMLAGRLVAVLSSSGADAGTGRVMLPPGVLTGRLVVEGVPVGDLAVGTRLRVGASVAVSLAALPVDDAAVEAAGGVVEAGDSVPVPATVIESGMVGIGDQVAVEAVTVDAGDVLDLHSFRPEEIPDVVAAYLAEAHANGAVEVRIVHGRGRGVQRGAVRRLLARASEVVRFDDAPPDRGGWGATLVHLRPGGRAAPR